MIRVLLIEDHASFGQALAGMAGLEHDLEVIAQTDRGESAIAEAHDADVAIVDLDLPGMAGVATITALREARAGIACVVLTASTEAAELGRAVEAGAAAVLHKSATIAEIFDVVRAVAQGANRLDPNDTARWLQAMTAEREAGWHARVTAGALSPRELEILRLLARGNRVPTIAETLGISTGTAQTHIRNLRTKLGASSQLEAVVQAFKLGLIDRPG